MARKLRRILKKVVKVGAVVGVGYLAVTNPIVTSAAKKVIGKVTGKGQAPVMPEQVAVAYDPPSNIVALSAASRTQSNEPDLNRAYGAQVLGTGARVAAVSAAPASCAATGGGEPWMFFAVVGLAAAAALFSWWQNRGVH